MHTLWKWIQKNKYRGSQRRKLKNINVKALKKRKKNNRKKYWSSQKNTKLKTTNVKVLKKWKGRKISAGFENWRGREANVQVEKIRIQENLCRYSNVHWKEGK